MVGNVRTTYVVSNWVIQSSVRLESIVESVIQATGKSEFVDGLRT